MATFPTEEQVKSFKAGVASQFKEMSENAAYRMKNYFDCVDDYSWGGPCDQAASHQRQLLNWAVENLEAQLEAGAPAREVFTTSVLMDMEGTIVSETIVNGRFGRCWMVRNGENVSFVSLAAKSATYAKKGFQVANRVYECEYFYTTKMAKNGLIIEAKILSERIEILEDVKNVSTEASRVLWFAKQN